MRATEFLAFEAALRGKRVFVTGHTGFTGSWACSWLAQIGVDICGFSLAPETSPSLWEELALQGSMQSIIGDICNREALNTAVLAFAPQVILHLAAQPLVRRSYREPFETFNTNVMGTLNVLEAARSVPGLEAIVCVTTDKVYENKEWPWPYRENDSLGGKDPYSASKSATEMVIQSYQYAFQTADGHALPVATARGGNIIGGGDWSEDRLVPDFVRAVASGSALTLRYPDATRPWQHVLALVQGYLMLAAKLMDSPKAAARSWNLGPADGRALTVRAVLESLSKTWTRPNLEYLDNPVKEAQLLALDSTLARDVLGWSPAWDVEETIERTAAWYRDFYVGEHGAAVITAAQISAWRDTLLERKHHPA
ncbi:CDP-glucose 4,6-dehydratase [Luteibacter rhizovicinus]|uniref:CDP-glucose 4,6-dehydratase n=1 Tax=Luteibacter rhizovicinus TaxID=242606 RepID=A0A4V2W4H2_9GAMM|nr:CDP-glucose 4,6-dehydratase [Luteibacter rhizovicinus]TCV95749.1 CDP-glucose 4,6-dehydratase [Luteibacter rhizovicinus]